MLCHQCGSDVEASEGSCANCGAELTQVKRLKLSESRGLRISQELKAIRLDQQLFPPGEEVAGRFVLNEMIGKGPFGEIYRARDKAIDAEVAVKVLSDSVLGTPLDEEKFLSVTRSYRRVSHQNLVRLHDSGMHKGHPWVSMQLLEGLTLRKVIDLRRSKGESFDAEEVEPIVGQIADALSKLPDKKMPHGNLKPANVVFLPDLIKVTDSFLYAALPAKSVILLQKSSTCFAPELRIATTKASSRADVFSVGILIREMLSTDEDQKSGYASKAIEAVVAKATSKKPASRYANVAQLHGAFRDALVAVPAPPPPPPDASDAVIVEPPAPPPGPAPPSDAYDTSDETADPFEQIETIEYNRELEERLQDEILTREAARDLPPPPDDPPLVDPMRRTVTAAAPRPSGPIPAPRPVDEGAPMRIVGLVVVIALLAAVAAFTMGDKEPAVEQIGDTPAQTPPKEAVVDKPTPPAEPANAQVAASAAATTVATAGTAAVAAVQTEPDTPPANTDPEPKPVEDTPAALATRKDPPKEETKSTGTDCPTGMRLVKSKKRGNYCIDSHEFPGAGSSPKTNVSWFQARKLCESRKKRLCSLGEWRGACGGKYPYGKTHDPDKCNTADEDGFERSLTRTGKFKQCRSRSGAFDMVGNAHEWVQEQKIAGGGFESDEEVGSCRYSSPKSPASTAPYIGFRCCAAAGGG